MVDKKNEDNRNLNVAMLCGKTLKIKKAMKGLVK